MASTGTPWTSAYNTLVDEALARAAGIFAAHPTPTGVLAAWHPVAPALVRIRELTYLFSQRVATLVMDRDITNEARIRMIGEARTQVQSEVAPLAEQIRAAVRTVIEKYREASSPRRPAPQDAAQETRILGIKTDLQMVLAGAQSSTELMKRMRDLLERALRDGDDLTAWVLTSRWPEDYLVSRGLEEFASEWSGYSEDALTASAPESSRGDLRQAYTQLTKNTTGITGLVDAMNTALARVLTEAESATQANSTLAVGNPHALLSLAPTSR